MTRLALRSFPKGGIHPNDNKFTSQNASERIPAPAVISLPLSQHLGATPTPLVKAMDKVKTGQLIAAGEKLISANIHSPVTGYVKMIDEVLDISGYRKPAFIIHTEPEEWETGIDLSPQIKRDIPFSAPEIIEKIKKAGIVGLGGATFPSHVKLMPPKEKPIDSLIINGAECEPYLTSDHRLMLEKGEEILVGVTVLMKALSLSRAMVGIEHNKKDAIAHLAKLAERFNGVEICALETKYPQGGERQIVKALLNREIPPPPKGLPMDVGCVVFNVATTFAVYEAVLKNKPLIERIVSVYGPSLTKPGNYWVRFGTPVSALIETAGGLNEDVGKILAGGPMMGKALSTADIPLTKGISGIVVLEEKDAKRKEVLNCIRCAKCVSVCPLGLEPYLLMALVEKEKYEEAQARRVTSCCECGCCSYICPANRPLLDFLKYGKDLALKSQKAKAANG